MKVMNLALAGLALAGLGLTGCKAGQATRNAQSVEKLLESDGSGDWISIKTETGVKNYAVFKGPDGYFYAFKTNNIKDGQTKAEFLASATVYDNLSRTTSTYTEYGPPSGVNTCPMSTDHDFTCHSLDYDERRQPIKEYRYDASLNRTWVTEIVYRDRNSGLIFEMGDSSSKDLEAVSAAIEMANNDSMRDMLVDGYGLSESRAGEIASLARSWQNIERSRAMTVKDLAQFESKVFGSDLNTVRKAYEKAAKGDKQAYEAMINKAAKLNDVSPEQAKAIFSNFMN